MKKSAAILVLVLAAVAAAASLWSTARATWSAWHLAAARYRNAGSLMDPATFASESAAKAAAIRAAAGPAPIGYMTDLPSPDAEFVAFGLQYDAAPLLFDLNPRLPAASDGTMHRFAIVGLDMDHAHPTHRPVLLEVSTNATPAVEASSASGYRAVWSDAIGGIFLRLYRVGTP